MKKMILTNENNIGTTFTEVDIIESFDDIINRFPTGNSTSMPGLKIYGDNTDQSKAKNIKIFNDAQQWRSNYISNNGLSDTGQEIRINVDAVLIDNIIMDKYDGNYNYYISIHNSRYYYGSYVHLNLTIHNNTILNVLSIDNDGLFTFHESNIFPSPAETRMPYLSVGSSYLISDNIKLYNDALQWRKDYISYNGLSDTGQPISMFVDKLYILIGDGAYMDKYDGYYHYHIDIYNDHIILLYDSDSSEVLTIYSDGSVTILDIFNKFPFPTSNIGTVMPGLKIYTDNTAESKSKNIKLYNDAQQYRKDYISNNNLSDKIKLISMVVDALMIDDITIDEYDNNNLRYKINIYNDHIILYKNNSKILTISSNGSVQIYYNTFPSDTSSRMPVLKIYTDNTEQSKSNNIKLYNNAQEWRYNYIIDEGLSDT